MLRVVTWKWRPPPGYRSTFGPEAVNTLAAMVRRHYHAEHELVCVTDDPAGLDPGIRVVPLWNDFAHVPSPHGGHNPSCYRRLRAFSAEMATVLGPRFVSIDLDTVICRDLRPVWDRSEDFVIWGGTHPTTWMNGSMFLMTAGARRQVWERFDPINSPRQAFRAGCFGSDQGWISFCLGRNEATWSTEDGVYSFRNHIVPKGGKLPGGARLVMFHGKYDPWQPETQAAYPWVREHYVGEAVAA